MASNAELWFFIEEAFAYIESQCVEARAAQLVLEEKRGAPAEGADRDAVAAASAPQGGASQGGAAGTPSASQQKDRFARAGVIARDMAFREAHPRGADIVVMRANVRTRLGALRHKLGETLDPRQTFDVLFPLTVHTDELANAATRGAATRWEPMQGELYELRNGGEVFFQKLDYLLRQPDTHTLVLQAYYFCLLDGFCGQFHEPDARGLTDYKERLRGQLGKIEPRVRAEKKTAKAPVFAPVPWVPYAIAAGVILLVYLTLRLLA
jgi:type IV/VI secretion system ImpK/VasF family protein